MAGHRQDRRTPAASSCPLHLAVTLKELRQEGGKRKEPTSVCVEAIQHFFADISQAAAAMPLVGRWSYLGNAGLCTMRTAGEEVGFNLTGHVYSSPLTFGLPEMCNESPGREAGRKGPWVLPPPHGCSQGPPGRLLCSACVQQPPTLQTQGRDFSRNKQSDRCKASKIPSFNL